MSLNNCRLCYSSTTKLTSSISDEIIQKFLNLLPQLDITNNSQTPTAVCQLCYGKAKISFDFIQKILEVQKRFKKPSPKKNQSNLKILNSKSLSTSEALEKVQKVGTISIKKVSAINQSVELTQIKEDEDLMDEVEDYHEVDTAFDVEGSSDEDYKVEKSESDDEEYLEDDDDAGSDDSYAPNAKKKKGNTSGSKSGKSSKGKNSTPVSKQKALNTTVETKEIIIDAPIAFSCAKCREKFPNFETLTDHMKSRVCHNEKGNCKICGKTFLNKKSLSNHMATHKPKEKYMCDVCAKEYNHQFDLESHMESVHHRVVKRNCIYRCTHCTDKFQSHLDLLEHVKEHQREKKEAPRLCEICAKVCANLKAYQSHIVIHKEKKAHTCTVCGKGFAKLFLYQQHMHVHTGVKAFACGICDRKYAKRDSLRVHKKRDHPDHIE